MRKNDIQPLSLCALYKTGHLNYMEFLTDDGSITIRTYGNDSNRSLQLMFKVIDISLASGKSSSLRMLDSGVFQPLISS